MLPLSMICYKYIIVESGCCVNRTKNEIFIKFFWAKFLQNPAGIIRRRERRAFPGVFQDAREPYFLQMDLRTK